MSKNYILLFYLICWHITIRNSSLWFFCITVSVVIDHLHFTDHIYFSLFIFALILIISFLLVLLRSILPLVFFFFNFMCNMSVTCSLLDINILFWTALVISHRFSYVVFLLVFSFYLFRSIYLSFYISVELLTFFPVICSFTFKSFQLLKLVLWASLWSVLKNVPCAFEIHMYFVAVGCNVL